MLFQRLPLATLLFALSVDSSSAANPIVESMRLRQRNHRVVNVLISVNETMAKGAVSGLYGKPTPGNKGLVIPPADCILESNNRLALDGEQFRYEFNHPMWNLSRGTKVTKSIVTTCNGKASQTVLVDDSSPEILKQGIIHANIGNEFISNSFIVPLTAHFRGDDRNVSILDFNSAKLVNPNLQFKGASHSEYVLALSATASWSFLFENGEGTVLKRARLMKKGKPTEQYDIEYGPHAQLGKYPSSWNYSRFGDDGKTVASAAIKVTQIDASIDGAEQTFIPKYPEGCVVYDLQQGNKKFRATSSGDLVAIDDYRGPQGDDPTGQKSKSIIARFKYVILSTVGAVLVVAILRVLIQRRKANAVGTNAQSNPIAPSIP